MDFGGTEVQTKREIDNIRNHGGVVLHITFDPQYPTFENDNWVNFGYKWIGVRKLLGKLVDIPALSKELQRVLNDFCPDVIHVNNVMHAPISVFRAVSGFPSVQTIRDYSAVCPKGTCVRADESECLGLCGYCAACLLKSKGNLLKLPYLVYKNHFRKKAFSRFLCPSEALTDRCVDKLAPTCCINNPYAFNQVNSCNPLYDSTRNYLFSGNICENKGIKKLLTAWEIFSSNAEGKVRLLLAGKMEDDVAALIHKYIASHDNVEYLGYMNSDDMHTVYSECYCVVVPSLWLENYPNVVLEAMAHRVIPIGSKRGGIPELIRDDRLLFDVTNPNDIVRAMKYVQEMDPDEYQQLTQESYMYVLENNNQELYYEKLTREFQICITEACH